MKNLCKAGTAKLVLLISAPILSARTYKVSKYFLARTFRAFAPLGNTNFVVPSKRTVGCSIFFNITSYKLINFSLVNRKCKFLFQNHYQPAIGPLKLSRLNME